MSLVLTEGPLNGAADKTVNTQTFSPFMDLMRLIRETNEQLLLIVTAPTTHGIRAWEKKNSMSTRVTHALSTHKKRVKRNRWTTMTLTGSHPQPRARALAPRLAQPPAAAALATDRGSEMLPKQ